MIFRTADNEIIVLEDRCPHRNVPLSMGSVNGDTIQCGYHGLRFDCTGTCVHVPGQDTIPSKATVKAYPSSVRDGWIWIWLGDPSKSDPKTIPSLPYFGSDNWAGFQKYFYVEGAAQLFVDNLLDLGHVPFTHAKSIGAASASDADFELDLSIDGDVVHGRRVVHNVEPGPFIGKWGKFTGNIQRRSTYSWRPPSVIEIEAHYHAVDNPEQSITIMVINPITPETETTAHFWIGWSRDFELDDAALTASSMEDNTQVIMEDVVIIEAQQKILDANPGIPAVPIKADKAMVTVHGIIERLLAKQTTTQLK